MTVTLDQFRAGIRKEQRRRKALGSMIYSAYFFDSWTKMLRKKQRTARR
jgi:hypothetical protein